MADETAPIAETVAAPAPADPSPVAAPADPSPVAAPAPAPDARTAFLSLSVDGQVVALFDHVAAVAVAVDNIAADIAAIKSAPAPVAALPPELETISGDVKRLLRHIFGA